MAIWSNIRDKIVDIMDKLHLLLDRLKQSVHTSRASKRSNNAPLTISLLNKTFRSSVPHISQSAKSIISKLPPELLDQILIQLFNGKAYRSTNDSFSGHSYTGISVFQVCSIMSASGLRAFYSSSTFLFSIFFNTPGSLLRPPLELMDRIQNLGFFIVGPIHNRRDPEFEK
ncbi:hypothetical protein ACLMJK_001627 [Lecanora helva]